MADVMSASTGKPAPEVDETTPVPPAETERIKPEQNVAEKTGAPADVEVVEEKEKASGDSAGAKSVEMSDVERIKAAHAARRSRRCRSAVPSPTPAPAADAAPEEVKDEDPALAKLKASHAEEMTKLKQEASNLRLEMNSLRRNHLQNIKKLTEERDMFAMQLAKEQNVSNKPAGNSKKFEDMNVQLRAARTRNNDLENENAVLRDEVKQLNFRVQASKTIDAATDGYERIVNDLVDVKLRCAQLEEEKEELLRMNKELSSTSHVLREANGELEKSRSNWVLQCADLEKKRSELEGKLKEREATVPAVGSDPSDSGSLQDVKLN